MNDTQFERHLTRNAGRVPNPTRMEKLTYEEAQRMMSISGKYLFASDTTPDEDDFYNVNKSRMVDYCVERAEYWRQSADEFRN